MQATETKPKATPKPPAEIVTTSDVQAMLGCCHSAARNMLDQLEAAGLKRKGRSRRTHYLKADFLRHYEAMDTRPG